MYDGVTGDVKHVVSISPRSGKALPGVVSRPGNGKASRPESADGLRLGFGMS
jgi:hypothetical protein